jgi:hypothetical protein
MIGASEELLFGCQQRKEIVATQPSFGSGWAARVCSRYGNFLKKVKKRDITDMILNYLNRHCKQNIPHNFLKAHRFRPQLKVKAPAKISCLQANNWKKKFSKIRHCKFEAVCGRLSVDVITSRELHKLIVVERVRVFNWLRKNVGRNGLACF